MIASPTAQPLNHEFKIFAPSFKQISHTVAIIYGNDIVNRYLIQVVDITSKETAKHVRCVPNGPVKRSHVQAKTLKPRDTLAISLGLMLWTKYALIRWLHQVMEVRIGHLILGMEIN